MLAVLFLVSTVSNVDRQIMTVAIEPIKAEFHATDTQMGLLTGAAYSLCSMPHWACQSPDGPIVVIANSSLRSRSPFGAS